MCVRVFFGEAGAGQAGGTLTAKMPSEPKNMGKTESVVPFSLRYRAVTANIVIPTIPAVQHWPMMHGGAGSSSMSCGRRRWER